MNLKMLFTVTAIVSAIFGVTDIFLPDRVIALWELTPGADLAAVIRLLGVSMVTLTVLAWSVRNAGQSDALRAVVLAFFVGNTLAVIVSVVVINQLGGTNLVGWSTTGLYVLLAAAFAYFQFGKSGTERDQPS